MNYFKIFFALFCLSCLFDMPYSYYELFRVVAMTSFIFLCIKEKDNDVMVLIWVSSAIIVQPFYKFYISREIWIFIDIFWATILFYSVFSSNILNKSNPLNKSSEEANKKRLIDKSKPKKSMLKK